VPTRAGWRGLEGHELAACALEGRSEAWDELIRRHSPRVRLVLLARGVPLDAADDLVQEAWVRLIEQQRLGRLQALELPGLAIAQARWLALEAARTRSRRERIVGHFPWGLEVGKDRDAESVAIHAERLARVERELTACPRRAREVFDAVYGPGGHSQAEVAKSLGLSVQRVRQILCEVRARARRALIEADGEGGSWDT
jgi:RNA polymerase sigma-70 factor (ECF subfamily)